MLALIASAFLTPVYKPLSTAVQEKLEVRYSGYLPIMGGQQGSAVATVTFTMAPQAPLAPATPTPTPPVPPAVPTPPQVVAKPGQGDAGPATVQAPTPKVAASVSTMGASLTLLNFSLSYNGFTLPIPQENAKRFFPGTRFDFDSNGRLVNSQVPKVRVPFRLPGLDIDRIPELAFLPIQFPPSGLEPNKTFHNHSTIDGTDVDLEVTPETPSGSLQQFSFKRTERYTVLEDSSNSVVPDPKDAVNRVETTVTGTGTAMFDLNQGRFVKVESHDQALSKVVNLTTNVATARKLRRVLTLTAP